MDGCVFGLWWDGQTTTSCYYGSLHLDATKVLADVVHAAGQRAFVGKVGFVLFCLFLI